MWVSNAAEAVGRLRSEYERDREMMTLRIVVEELLSTVRMAPGWANKMPD